MQLTVIVAAHKPYWMPADTMYLPVQVGSTGKPSLGWQRDDEGENISAKNTTFCELTGLYWLWKHVAADAYGLVHYRRYFATNNVFLSKQRRIMNRAHAEALLERHAVVLPKKRHYWIETNYSHYVHAHHEEDLTLTQAILTERCPQYLPAWERTMVRRSGHRFNMFLMRRELFVAYCTWMFDILFELERRLDISGYSAKDRRVFGYVSERLLDVWLLTHGIQYAEVSVVNLESQHWPKKIYAFLKRKLAGKRAK